MGGSVAGGIIGKAGGHHPILGGTAGAMLGHFTEEWAKKKFGVGGSHPM